MPLEIYRVFLRAFLGVAMRKKGPIESRTHAMDDVSD